MLAYRCHRGPGIAPPRRAGAHRANTKADGEDKRRNVPCADGRCRANRPAPAQQLSVVLTPTAKSSGWGFRTSGVADCEWVTGNSEVETWSSPDQCDFFRRSGVQGRVLTNPRYVLFGMEITSGDAISQALRHITLIHFRMTFAFTTPRRSSRRTRRFPCNKPHGNPRFDMGS